MGKSMMVNENELSFLQKLDEMLKGFILSTLEFHELEEEREFDILPRGDQPETLKCRVELKCKQMDCPCYESQDYRCWLVAGTLCGGKPQGAFAQKYKSCFNCRIFRQFTDTTINSVYENIGIVIKHLGDKTKYIRELAIKDHLTGLYNRNYLGFIEGREIEAARRRSAPLSIIVFDLDNFKSVNDAYGHLTGDEILKAFGAFLQKQTRASDLLFRLGGDEFLLIMNGTDEPQCRFLERRLLEAVEEWNESGEKTIPVPLSFSLGSATTPDPRNFEELMEEADKKMYAHKQSKSERREGLKASA
ncbi:MAG: GGDEF domain-containing protein [Myxococcales bacterium]|nr:MAG: GGDEF domain-containing protein [Myxococcales bacterium]